MIYSPYATKITRDHQNGKPMRDCTPDMTNRRTMQHQQAARAKADDEQRAVLDNLYKAVHNKA